MQAAAGIVSRNAIAAACAAALLTGCWSSSSSDNTTGVIGFDDGVAIDVTAGSHREVILRLQDAPGIVGRKVVLASSDAAVADVTPSSCTLSSSSESSSKCTVKVHGKSAGVGVVLAQSAGYADAQLTARVAAAIAYGNLAVSNGSGTFVTTSPVSLPMPAQSPYQVTVKGRIHGSSGITIATGAYINFSSTSAVTFNPPQCQVTSAQPECDSLATLPSTSPVSITAAIVGAITAQSPAPNYTPITINVGAAPSQGPNGVIALSTQSGNDVPNGMKAPLFVNWTNPVTSDTVTVNLTIAGSGVSFYSFTPGNNTNINESQTQTCTLTYTGAASSSVQNCGLGLVGSATSGTVTINATASGSAGTYTIAPLTLGAVAPAATRRSVTFTNSSSRTIYVGITGGAASSYINPTTPSIPAGTTTANMKPGAGSTCGPSNAQAACPIGTTCVQGGYSPSSSITSTPFYCYYDQPTPSNGYQLAANSGATTIDIPGSSLAPNGIIWSGNFYARTGCDANGNCENATCVGGAGGLGCGPGTGPTPGTNTLAELTFQSYPATDYYDVSIINGVNFATAFGPTNVSISSSNAYFCGTAGSSSAQGTGYASGQTSLSGLPAAPWTMAPSLPTTTSTGSFPPGVSLTTGASAASYYRVVIPSTSPGTACLTSSTCTNGTDTACGWPMWSVALGSGFNYAGGSQVCGKPVAWMTADTIWGQNSTSANQAPFAFTQSWANGNGGTVSVGDLQLCINSTYSAYINNGTSTTFPIQPVALACGGVMWGATESPGPQQNPTGNAGLGITVSTQPVQTANGNWLSYVLPTIQWLKQACPTCYTYPFDDMTSTFTCSDASRNPSTSYGVTFTDVN